MRIENLKNHQIAVEIPLTFYSSSENNHVRIKKLQPYGIQVATSQEYLTKDMYVEWQIKYQGDTNELDTCLELFVQNNIITIEDINKLVRDLNYCKSTIPLEDYLLNTMGMPISFPNHPYNQLQYIYKYPSIIFRIQNGFWIEVSLEKRGYACGVQPMLYVCFPITELRQKENMSLLLGRVAESKECATLILESKDKSFLLETFKIFGMLSKNHNYDIREILNIVDNL